MFNLIDAPWIPVLYKTGKYSVIGIETALMDEGAFQLAHSNPMDRLAVFRFLLGVCYWCADNTGISLPDSGKIPQEWLHYLAENSQLFELLGDGRRFFQDSHALRLRPSTDLIQEVPAGNNFWHFKHTKDYVDGLCPACCAQGLLRMPLFAVSGLPNLKAGINGSPPVYTIFWGGSLMESLTMNWAPVEEMGEPAWVSPMPSSGHVPLLTGMTMLPRRVFLHDPQGIAAACASCGVSTQPLIYSCFYDASGTIANQDWKDPHILYDPDTGKPFKAPDPVKAGEFRFDKPWQEVLSNFLRSHPPTSGHRLLLVGLATQQAKYIDVWEKYIVLKPYSGKKDERVDIRQWKRSLGKVSYRLGKYKRSENRKIPLICKALFQSITPGVEHQISCQAGSLATSDLSGWQETAKLYWPAMRSIARAMFPGVTSGEYSLRRKVSSTLPKMEIDTEPQSQEEVPNEQ